MKRLIIMRHGKSDWKSATATDHGRPLAKRGRVAAKTMGLVLTRANEQPDLVITSTATRARDTASLAAKSGEWDCEVEETERLYLSGPDEMIKIASAAGDNVNRLLLVGHQPTCADLIYRLTGGIVQVKTATVVGLDVGIDAWEELPGAEATIGWVLQPRMFTDYDIAVE
ncbi:MAG: histidine phosphatase family protein [Acidimicrobiia bacterium]|nr:histidine phosphatase family protein [Acidimicrobiia bacterium]